MQRLRPVRLLLLILGAALFAWPAPPASAAARLELKKGDRVVLIGNTLAEREQHFGHFETLLHSRFPELELVVRDLGWSADELTLRPRSLNFKDHGHNLDDHKADVILAFFGFNESFGGKTGLAKFEGDLARFIDETNAARYNGSTPPRLVLVSPIPHEDVGRAGVLDGKANNENIRLYTQSMERIAREKGVAFVDLFHSVLPLMQGAPRKLTFNGIHLTDYGYSRVAPVLDEALFGPRPAGVRADLAKLRGEVLEKNQQFFYDYRAVNGYYIYGGRKNPFGVVNFPPEFAKLRKMIASRDQRIWGAARGEELPATIDDGKAGVLERIPTIAQGVIKLTSPEESHKAFKVAGGYEINLFASEVDFPDLRNPCQCAFDARGRLWVTTMDSYPQYMPGVPVNDKILILEDTDGDGRADRSTVFADKLYLPTGIELGDGGCYVAQQPNLVFLKDTDGDGKADHREIILHGFDTADSHHSISAFTWGPDGALYFQEGTFFRSQIETPYGPVRLNDGGVYRYEPRTEKLDVYVSYGFANPWGHVFDRWGQDFVSDASPGANYFAAAFSGSVDYPRKHRSMKQFLVKQWRPTAASEIVSSRNFPDEAQGNFLLNNCIGFQGTLQYKFRDEGSGFFASPVEPLVQSSDTNYRPIDMRLGPDGALYIVDWYNPLIGHMQYSIRDPNRDHTHGRVWRVRYASRPLASPAKIAGEPIPALLDLLKEYEDRTRYNVRRELRQRDTAEVVAELKKWISRLDASHPEYQHQLLEALWVHQQHDAVDEALLTRMLRSPDYRARAAATRVLCYWRDRLDKPLELLRAQVNDEHPRVRLEAVRALSFFHDPAAIEVALESLAHPQDDYLSYTFKETMDTLEARTKAK
jgi:hypothetical protein